MSRPTPETDALSRKQYIRIEASSNDIAGLLNDALKETEDHARKLERERDDYKWQLHIAKGEIAEARKMERTWKKEETK